VLDNQTLGIILALAAAFSWGLAAVLFKATLKPNKLLTDLLFSIAIRGIIAVPFIGLVTLLINGYDSFDKFAILLSPELFPLVLLSSIVVTAGDVLFFGSLQRIEVSKAQPVASIYPLFTAFLLIFSGIETVSAVIIMGIILLITGIGLVAQQKSSSQESDSRDLRTGLVMAVAAAIFWSLAIVTVRLILEHPGIDVFALATLRFGMLTLFVLISWIILIKNQQQEKGLMITSSRKEVLILGVTGILSWGTGAVTFFISIDLIGAGRATPISSINPLIALIFGVIILKEKLTPAQGAGVLLVILGSIIVSL